MFSKVKTISEAENQRWSEAESQRWLLENLKGESASYGALIQDTINDLVAANENILMEENRTNEIIADLTATRDELKALRTENTKLIEQLTVIFPKEESVG